MRWGLSPTRSRRCSRRPIALRLPGARADLWNAVAESVQIVELTGVGADEVELTVVDGERTLTIGDEQTNRALPALDALAAEYDAVAIHAERVDGETFAVDVFPL